VLSAQDSPPLDLLAEWGVHTAPIIATPTALKPRGRNGPYPTIPTPAALPNPPPTSATESVLALTVASATMMMNHMMQSTLNPNLANQPVLSLKRPLSPLPDVHEELNLFMHSFGQFHGLSDEIIGSAFVALQDKGYSPFVLKDKDLDVARIRELTGLNEGAVLGLRQFAGDWVERQKVKRTRYD